MSNFTPIITSNILEFYFKINKNTDYLTLVNLLKDSAKNTLIDTIILAFYFRNCRGGKGLRKIGNESLQWLAINYPVEMMKVLHLVSEYGRFDDLYHFYPKRIDLNRLDNYLTNISQETIENVKVLQKYSVELVAKQLIKDYQSMMNGDNISLMAKWAATENNSLDQIYNIVDTTCEYMNINKKEYRKKYLSPLRTYLQIVEKYMCTNEWNKINYFKVPKKALKNLSKAFQKHDKNRFKSFLYANKQNRDIHQVLPYNIVSEYSKQGFNELSALSSTILPNVEQKWEECVKTCKILGHFKNTVAVLDSSGSMYGERVDNKYLENRYPLNVALSLGLLIARCSEGVFANSLINFSKNPKLNYFPENETLLESLQKLTNLEIDKVINFSQIFELIINEDKDNQVERVIFFTDNSIINLDQQWNINLKRVIKKYIEIDQILPTILYFNINSNDINIMTNNRFTEISGMNDEIQSCLLNNDIFNPCNILNNILGSDRYKPIRDILQGKEENYIEYLCNNCNQKFMGNGTCIHCDSKNCINVEEEKKRLKTQLDRLMSCNSSLEDGDFVMEGKLNNKMPRHGPMGMYPS